MSTVGLFDRLVLKRQTHGFALRCDDPALPGDHRNLVYRAASAFADHAGMRLEQLNCSIVLGKSIPSGAGLGGGSSDAASTLSALNRLHATGWSAERLMQIGSTLGSDVPFFFAGPSALVQGRGEAVEPCPAAKVKWIVLVLPPIHVSTADCYRQFDTMGLGSSWRDDEACNRRPDVEGWATLPAGDLGPRLVNDLEPPAFALRPDLAS
jgi:4-diphosphocytidyl-2-C-methyl-D-erythritol kinase